MESEVEYLHFCDDQLNKYFAVYNIKEKFIIKYDMPYDTTYLFDSAQIKDCIYFTGGGLPSIDGHSERFFQKAVEVRILKDGLKIEMLPNMNVSRSNHTLVAVGENLLYAIGGCNTKAQIPACEKYDITKKEWTLCASLNEKKIWASVCVFNDRYLYSFGGSTNLKPKESNLIEYLDIEDKTAILWTKVELKEGKELWPRCFFMGCLQVEPNCILLFGGLVGNNEVDDTYYFDPIEKVITKGPKLEGKDGFYRTKPVISGKEVMAVGCNEGELHVYDITDKKWLLIKKDKWNPDIAFKVKAATV